MRPTVFVSFVLGTRANLFLMRRPWRLARWMTPIDFVRYREFSFAYSAIMRFCPNPSTALDISSPSLVPLTLAYTLRDTDVVSVNILPSEVHSMKLQSERTALGSIGYQLTDARSLAFKDCTFDLVTSVSVFEHISPEHDGEIHAVQEITRILIPGGIAILTVPFSRRYFAEYVNRAVYERPQTSDQEEVFFQRFYDEALLRRVFVQESGLDLAYLGFIYERHFSPDPHTRLANYINASPRQKLIFGPLYPVLSRVFLSRPQPLQDKGKPYIACLVLRKR